MSLILKDTDEKLPKIILKRVVGKSKSGKTYEAYQVVVGLFEGPLFFPSALERQYLNDYIAVSASRDFKKGQEGVDEPLDDLDD